MTRPDVVKLATEYAHHGWCPVPIPPREKGPRRQGWQKLRIAPEQVSEHFTAESNVGVLVGEPSGLMDVDLDCSEALALAPMFLPATPAKHGRASSPTSHWWYRPTSTTRTAKYQDPTAPRDKATLVELRGSGCQTMVPPSVHPNGELVSWEATADPIGVGLADLQRAVRRLASAALLARHWPGQGARHDASLALCGALAREQWSEDDITTFVTAVSSWAHRDDPKLCDGEPGKRRAQARDSIAKVQTDTPASGWPTLVRLGIPERASHQVQDWLGVERRAEDAATLETVDQRLAERGLVEFSPPTATDLPDRYGIDIVDFLGDEDDDESDDDEWIVRGLIPAGVPSIFGGPPKSKKTFALLYAAICVAAGRDMLGFATKRGRVLVICREDSARTIRRRIRKLARGLSIDPAELREWLRVDAVKPLYFDRDADVKALYETVEEFRPALVAIDCLSRIHLADENDRSSLAVVTNRWMDICTRFGCAVTIIHHDRKGASHGHDPGAALRGSGDLHALVRGVVGFEPKERDLIKVVAAGNLDAFAEPFAIRYIDEFTEGGPPRKVLRLDRIALADLKQHKDAASARDLRREVLQAFVRESAFPSATALVGAVGRNRAAVLRVVSDLVGEKLIRRDGNALSPINPDRLHAEAAVSP